MKKLIIFAALAMLTACASNDYKFDVFTLTTTGVKPVKVKLEIEGGKLITKKEANTKCTPFANKFKKGCFVAEEGEMVEVEFKLQHPGGDTKWRFTKLLICSGIEKPDPLTDCSLDSDQRADWAVLANNEVAWPNADGSVKLSLISEQLREFSLRDFNWLADDYFYWIQACPDGVTDEAQCVAMDPGSVNKGRGR